MRSLLNEIGEKYVKQLYDKIGSSVDSLPFDNIFKGKKRILIPFVSHFQKQLKEKIEEIGKDQGKNLSVNLENGTIVEKIKTHQGEKERETRIGKVLQKNKEDILKKFVNFAKSDFVRNYIQDIEFLNIKDIKISNERAVLDFLQTLRDMIKGSINMYYGYNDEDPQKEEYQKIIDESWKITREIQNVFIINEKYNKEGSGQSIILSRAPIDVLRMSDFKNIQSCHSEGGSYFKCAIQEAEGHGPIAYLVKNDDIKNLDLDQDEIFSDKERGISGINPIARVRLRKFVNNVDGYSLAVPEVRVYGQDIGGFLDTVTTEIFERQKDLLPKDKEGNVEFPQMNEFFRTGGSYQDNPASELFNNFFDTEQYRGDVDFEGDDDDYTNIAEQYREEAQNINNRYHFDHCWSSFDVEGEDDEAYVYWDGGISFEYDLEKLGIDYEKYEYVEEFIKFIRGGKFRSIISHLDFPTLYDIDVEYTKYSKYITIKIFFENGSGHPDDFGQFLNELKDIEKKYGEYYLKIRNLLVEEGQIEDKFEKFVEETLEKITFENFQTYFEPGELSLYYTEIFFYNGDRGNKQYFDHEFVEEARNKIKNYLWDKLKDENERVKKQLILPHIEVGDDNNFDLTLADISITLDQKAYEIKFKIELELTWGTEGEMLASILTTKEIDKKYLPIILRDLQKELQKIGYK